MSYCRDELFKVCAQCTNTILDKPVLCSIRLSGIARRRATHRGCRGGLKRKIPIIVTPQTLRPPTPRGNGHNPLNVIEVNLKPNHAEHKQALHIGLVNCQSVVNKKDEIADYTRDFNMDIVALTETWLTGTETDQVVIGDVTPPGYVFNHIPRTNRKGGGVAILSKTCLKIKTHVPYKAKSFENFQATITCSGTTIRLAVIYRLHPHIKKNGVRNHDFFEEFASFIDTLASQTGHLILLGDFNIHWDIKDELNTKKLVELLASSNLTQHVHESTHKLGHIIDLVITRSDDDLVNAISVSSLFSDHHIVNISTTLTKPQVPSRSISYRKFRDINIACFIDDLRNSELITNPPDDLRELCELYDSTMTDIVDKYAQLSPKPRLTHTMSCGTQKIFKLKNAILCTVNGSP